MQEKRLNNEVTEDTNDVSVDTNEVAEDTIETQTPGAQAEFILASILDLGGIQADVELLEDTEEEATLAISGPDAGVLVGNHGQTLDSLQYLVSLIVNKDRTGRSRINVDSDGYRARRTVTLTKFAQSLADQVVATGQEAITDPLNPQERRIIHTALQDNLNIKTYSEGYEPNRYVVVSPRESDPTAEA